MIEEKHEFLFHLKHGPVVVPLSFLYKVFGFNLRNYAGASYASLKRALDTLGISYILEGKRLRCRWENS